MLDQNVLLHSQYLEVNYLQSNVVYFLFAMVLNLLTFVFCSIHILFNYFHLVSMGTQSSQYSKHIVFLLYLCELSAGQQQAGCPSGCFDETPPDSAYSCNFIVNTFRGCGTRMTSGDRYCQCSCKTCTNQQPHTPPPSPSPSSDSDGWFLIDDPSSVDLQLSVSTSPESPTPPISNLPPALPPPAVQSTGKNNSNKVFQSQSQRVQFAEDPWTPVVTDVYPQRLAFTVGGARGIGAFRRDIDNNLQPSLEDITYEGIFAEYYFDISGSTSSRQCQELFCAKYCVAVSTDPLRTSSPKNLYLGIGLESGQKLKDFKRKDLDLVIVLDISGSMGGTFGIESDQNLAKIDVAKDAIKNVMKHLTSNDRLGVVTFESTAKIVQSLKSVTPAMQRETSQLLDQIRVQGLTNLEDGLKTAVGMMTEDSRQNRIIVITDANPNTGEYSSEGLAAFIKDYAFRQDPIFTTLIGVGLDFNSELTRDILQTRGANYFAVYSPAELQSKLDEEFEYLVSPFIFDLRVEVDMESLSGSDGWFLMEAYGVPEPQGGVSVTHNATVLQVSTLFPTPSSEEGNKGGIILLSVFPKSNTPKPLKLAVSYKDTDFNTYSFTEQVDQFSNFDDEYYGTTAIRKAIVLSHYVQLLRNWLRDTSATSLTVPSDIGNEFNILLTYMIEQNMQLQDPNFEEEIAIVKKLIGISA
eukprot:TRINITY_DN43_c0_g1_i2.p1 TRINITY_DN43_c0_g1~~TRINITY_DN43_c0_g1_i2.p1  ORF type:complete len:692 (-),score=51.56 TRINITY_DN43_c0_g1_i2:990-3065(-)